MKENPSTERDTPKFAEPLAGLFARVRYQSYLLVTALIVVLVQGAMLFLLGSKASAHVYEVHPDGQASYVGSREANLAPRSSEARWVARQFVELLYGWNSSTVHQDLANAVSMCSKTMGDQLRTELAQAQFVEGIRRRNIRSEVAFEQIEVQEHGRRHSRVRVSGAVNVFPLAAYEGMPIESRPFALMVVLAAVPRDPEVRLNGLEVARLVRDQNANEPEDAP